MYFVPQPSRPGTLVAPEHINAQNHKSVTSSANYSFSLYCITLAELDARFKKFAYVWCHIFGYMTHNINSFINSIDMR
jgi:hypothetical protein